MALQIMSMICTPHNIVTIQNTQEKANLQKTRVNDTKTERVHVDRNKLPPGKEWMSYT